MIQFPVPEEDYRYVERVIVRGLTFGPGGRTLVALLGDPGACVHIVRWDLERGTAVETLDGGWLTSDGSERYADPAFSSDHRLLARTASSRHASVDWVILDDRTASPFDRRNLRFGGEPSSVRFLRFSPDGRFLFAAGMATDPSDEDGEPRDVMAWWDVAALPDRNPPGVPYHFFEPAGDQTFGSRTGVASFEVAHWSPGLVAVGGDGWVSVYRFNAGALTLAWFLEEHAADVRRLAFSPDCVWLAAAAGREVTFYDPTGGGRKGALKVDGAAVNDLAFSPRGRILATACGDGVVRFHRPPGGAPFRQFTWDLGPVSAVAFSPDGCTCAAGGEGGRVAWWDVDD
jgi:WD40 repeat protein